MPYPHVHDLPQSVRDNIPGHAQAIDKEAFNHAWAGYQDPAR